MESLTELYKIGFGPSSSHTMGPARASEYFIAVFPKASRYEVILYGSLSLTGRGHLTDAKIIEVFHGRKIDVIFSKKFEGLTYSNTMDFFAYSETNQILGHKRIYSIGGGSILVEGEERSKIHDVYPFENFSALIKDASDKHMSLSQLVYHYENPDIKNYLLNVWNSMKATIAKGLETEGFLPGKLHISRKAKFLSEHRLDDKPWEQSDRELMCYAYAAAEENACGGVVVTAPTCGSSGVLPAAMLFLQKNRNLSDGQIIDALAVASLIGNMVKQNASISGADCGCMAEIGTATAMTAAAIAYLNAYTNDQIEYAAEVSLEHHLGLTCDPVEGYVQIPCIERNAVCVLRAFDAVSVSKYLTGSRRISLDVVIKTMNETGRDLTDKYRETSQGGLAKSFDNR